MATKTFAHGQVLDQKASHETRCLVFIGYKSPINSVARAFVVGTFVHPPFVDKVPERDSKLSFSGAAAFYVVAGCFAAGFAMAVLLFPVFGLSWTDALLATGGLAIAAGATRRACVAEARVHAMRFAEMDAASYRSFVDNAVDGIFRTTRNGRYLFANRALAKIYGYDSPDQMMTELDGSYANLYVDPARRAEFETTMRRDEHVRNFDARIRRRDGSIIWISENARAVFDADGSFLYYEGTVEDITAEVEGEEARRALREAQDLARAESLFLAAMSHELRTPLNAVIEFSEVLVREVFGPIEDERYKSYLKDIHDNGCRLLSKINDILDMSHLDSGLVVLQEALVSLREVVEWSWASVAANAEDLPFLQVEISDDLPLLRGDLKRLRQIVRHLLSNATKFTPRTGHIVATARLNETAGITFTIVDDGIGMDPKGIASALEPFRQLDGRLSRQFEGAGLGLPLALASTRLHGGELHLDSAPGKGTAVRIEFPATRVVMPRQVLSA